MKLNLKAMTVAVAVLWAGAVFIVGVANLIWPAYGKAFLTPRPVPLHELPGLGNPDRAQGDLPPYCTMC